MEGAGVKMKGLRVGTIRVTADCNFMRRSIDCVIGTALANVFFLPKALQVLIHPNQNCKKRISKKFRLK